MSLPNEPVAIITGASSGIGRALAIRLARRGAQLHLIARGLEGLESTAAECESTRACIHATDLTDDDAVRRVVDRIAQQSGRVDLLIHAMGILAFGNIESTSVDSLDDHYRSNVRAPFVITQALLPALRRSQGQVVFLNSSVVRASRPSVAAYAASKHALRALADTLREEVNDDGVRVLSVYPGRTATPMQRSIAESAGTTYAPERLIQPGDLAESIVSALELPRSAEVTDLFIRPMRKG